MSSAFEGLPKTPNLSLNKPGYDNVADIEALNENADILDEEISTIKSNLKNKGSATEPIYFDGNGVPQKTKNFTDYLPLAGGTMTGAIETNGDIINPSNNNTFIRIKGSKEYQQGAELLLSGKTLTDHEGLFYLIANNGTKSTKLLGKADGNLLWGAKHIARSVNGINATPDGNINLGITPIANGGTGATTAVDACENLGASNKDLSNITDTGKANITALGMPDYSAGVSLANNVTTTCTYDCFVNVYAHGIGSGSADALAVINILNASNISINSFVNRYFSNSSTTHGYANVSAFIPKDYKFKASYSGSDGTITMYPLKGVNN